MTDKLEIKVNHETIVIDKFISFGFDDKYFAIKGDDLYYYYHLDNGYRLLDKKFNETILRRIKKDEKHV